MKGDSWKRIESLPCMILENDWRYQLPFTQAALSGCPSLLGLDQKLFTRGLPGIFADGGHRQGL